MLVLSLSGNQKMMTFSIDGKGDANIIRIYIPVTRDSANQYFTSKTSTHVNPYTTPKVFSRRF